MSTNKNLLTKHRYGEVTLGRKIVSVGLSLVMVWSMWPSNATAALADELAAEPTAEEQVVEETPAEEETTTVEEEAPAAEEETSTVQETAPAAEAAPAATEQDTSASTKEETTATEATPTSADVALDLSNATITYNNQVIDFKASKVNVPTDKDFKFTAEASNGYNLSKVEVSVNGSARTELTADADGVYTISAADVLAGASLTVSTEAQPEAATEAPAETVTSDTVIESETTDSADEQADSTTDAADQSETGETTSESTDSEKSDSKSDSATTEKNDTTDTTTDSGNWLTNFFGGFFGGNQAQTTSLYDNSISTVASASSYTLEIGDSQAIAGATGYYHTWTSSDPSVATVSGTNLKKNSSKTTVGTVTAKAAGTATITHTYKTVTSSMFSWTTTYTEQTETFTITVNAAHVDPISELTISGSDSVKQFANTTLTTNATTLYTVTWSSSDTSVATVDQTGKVVGIAKGTAKITATAADADGNTFTAVKEVTVTDADSSSSYVKTAYFFFLKQGSTPSSNASSDWYPENGASIYAGSVNIEGATWDSNNKNCTDNVVNRVVSWPSSLGSMTDKGFEISKTNTYWSTLFKEYKSQIGDDITEDDVEAIILHPYKISNNSSGYHLDCTVEIIAKSVVTADFYLWEAGDSGYVLNQTKNYRMDGDSVSVAAPDMTKLPETKTVNGVTYKLYSWYTDEGRSGSTVDFPYTASANVKFYAKYVPMNQTVTVNYYKEGTTEKVATSEVITGLVEGTKVTRKPIEIKGYTAVDSSAKSATAGTDSEINFYYTAKEGKAGYNLVLDGATWTAPEDVSYSGEGQKYYYTYGFAKGDTFNVTSNAPSADNAVFLGWMDKARGDQEAAIREAGDTITYIYKSDTYTLDALWASLSATGTTATYDGQEHGLTSVSVEINNTSLDEKYKKQAKDLISEGDIEYSTDGVNWSTTAPTFKDAGTYTVYVREYVTVGKTGAQKTLTAQADVVISPATYYVETSSSTKAYDGTELSGTATVKGLVNGETATATATTVGPNVTASTSNAVTGDITWGEGVNPDNYKRGTDQLGTLEITARPITVTATGGQKAYDGSALTATYCGYTLSEGGLAGSDAATVTLSGSVTYPSDGEKDAVVDTVVIKDAAGNDVSSNYDVTKTNGKLKIVDREVKYEVTLEANGANVTYDGQSHSATGVKTNKFTFDNVEYTISGYTTTDPSETNAGSYANTIDLTNVKVTDPSGNDVTAQFNVKKADANLVINQREITVTANGGSKEYDGDPITAADKGYTISSGSLAGGQKETVSLSGSQTQVGSSDATVGDVVIKSGNDDVTSNYKVTTVNGTLTVTNRNAKYQITLEANSGSVTYDGEKHSASGVVTDTFTFNNKTYTVSGFTTSGAVDKVDAGTYANTVSTSSASGYIVKDAEGNDVSAQFAVTPQAGTLTIAKRDVTIASADLTKEYNGVALTNGETALKTNSGWVEGQGVVVTFTGSQLLVGNSKNAFTYAPKTGTNLDNYNITKTEGTLTVTNRDAKYEITVEANSSEATYDGSEHSATGLSTTEFTVDGNKYYVSGLTTEDPKATNAGTYTNNITGTAVVKDVSGNDVTDQFSVKTTNGKLVVSPKAVTLTSDDGTWTYDGNEHSAQNVTANGFVGNDGATYSSYAAVTNVTPAGGTDNSFEYKLNDGVVAANYTITKAYGKLVVNPVADKVIVTVTENSAEATYDGAAHTVSGYKSMVSSNDLYDVTTCVKETATDGWTVSGTNAGTYNVDITADDFQNTNPNFSNVEFKVVDGSLTINKRNVTFTGKSETKTYTGSEQTINTVEVSTGANAGLVSGDTHNVTFVAAGIEAGTYPGTITPADDVVITSGEGESAIDVTANYNIVTTPGTLTITQDKDLAIDVTAAGYEGTYDGQTHTGNAPTTNEKSGTTVISYSTDGGENWSTELPDITDAGEITVIVRAENPNYSNVPEATYTLKVNKATINVTASETVTYDGSEKTLDAYDSTKGTTTGVVSGEELTLTGATVSGTEQGEYTTLADGWIWSVKKYYGDFEFDSTGNYDINVNAKLTIAKATDLVVNAQNVDTTYDGQAHGTAATTTAAGTTMFTYYVDGSETGTAEYPTFTDAGEHTIKVVAHNDNYDEDAEKTYTIKIAKKALKVYAEDDKTYNGQDQTLTIAGENTVVGYAPVTGETLTVSGATITGKTAGDYTTVASGYTWDVTRNGVSDKDNYTLEVTGKLTISQVTDEVVVTIVGATAENTYDGSDHTATGYTVTGITGSSLYTSDNVQFVGSSQTATQKNAGTATMGLTAESFKNANNNFAYVTFVVTDGYSKVNKREMTITSDSASKTYDGTALSKQTVTGENFATGEGATYTEWASRTDEGKTDNTYTMTLNEGTSADNYTITNAYGTLTVNKASDLAFTNVEALGYEGTYDAASHTGVAPATNGIGTTKIEYSTDGGATWSENQPSITNYGETTVKVRATNPNYSNTAETSYTLKVNKFAITVSNVVTGQAYTGSEQTVDAKDGNVTALPGNETLTLDGATISRTDVGTTEKTFSAGEYSWSVVKSDGTTDSTDNYTISVYAKLEIVADGELSITNVNALSYNGVYDGNAHGTAATTNAKSGTTTFTYYVDGSATGTSTYPTVTDVAEHTVRVVAHNDNYAKDAEATYTLKVTPKAIELYNESTGNTYDGQSHSVTVGASNVKDGNGTVAGETLTINGAGISKVNAGTYTTLSDYTWSVTKADGTVDTSNYTISVGAKLVIDQYAGEVVVTVSGTTATKTYTGLEQSVSGYTVSSSDGLYAARDGIDFSFSGTAEAKGTDVTADGYSMTLKAGEFTNTNPNFSNVKFQIGEQGKLTITPAALTLKTNTATKKYDGTKLAGAVTEFSGFVNGETATATATAVGPEVTGETENVATITWTNAKSGNYTVSTEYGNLSITATGIDADGQIDVTTGEAKKMYDGSKLDAVTATAKDPNNQGYDFKVEYSTDGGKTWSETVPSITNVKESTTVQVRVSDPAGNYSGYKYAEEALTVTARDVTMLSGDVNEAYTGETYKNENVTESGSGFVSGEGVTYSDFATIKEVGSKENTYKYTANSGTDLSNYSIDQKCGTLNVTTGDITKYVTVSGNDVTKEYDGNTYTASVATAVDANGNALKVEYSADGQNWTEDPSTIGATNVDDSNANIKIRVSSEAAYGKDSYVYASEALTITARNITLTAASGEKTYDGSALTKNATTDFTVSAGSFVGEEGVAGVTISGSQTLVGASDNTITDHELKSNTKACNYIVGYAAGTLTVKDTDVDASDVISKTHAGTDTEFALGETVTFTITAKNIYAEAKDMTFSEVDGVTITGQSKFENVAAGQTVSTTATHVITEADLRAGEFVNTATVTFGGQDGKSYQATDTAQTDEVNSSLSVTKKSTDSKDSYGLYETINYAITVTNNGNQTVKNITVTDPNADNFGEKTIESLEPGKSVEFAATHQVTEADILAGSVTNAATASGTSDAGGNVENTGETTDNTDNKNGELTVYKSVTNEKAEYELGDTIEYYIFVKNTGNLTITNVTLTDENADGFGTVEVGTLGPNQGAGYIATHVVTEADVRAGKVSNVATATGTSPDTEKPEPEVKPGQADSTTETAKSSLSVTKTSADADKQYKLGETISYTITVTNDGNQTVSNIEVTDPNADNFGTKTIASLAPGASESFDATHTVTEDDLLAGEVVNSATAKGTSAETDPEGNPKDVEKTGETTNKTEAADGKLSVTKTVTNKPADDKAFVLGETISYSITVKNEGNLTVKNITVTDPNADGFGEKTIDSLEPGATETFTATHVVTQSDIANGDGEFLNSATAKGETDATTEGDKNPEASGDVQSPIEGADKKLTVTKAADETKTYALGETIKYTITVKNTGNQDVSNITVSDPNGILEGAGADGTVTIDSLTVGQSATVKATHTVTSVDILAGSVANSATASSDNPSGTVPGTGTDTQNTAAVDTTLGVSKSVSNQGTGEGGAFKSGDTIKYTIIVANNGNVPYKNVKVEDAQTGLSETIADLAVGATKTYTVSHVVTDADIIAGTYTNTVTAKGDDVTDAKGNKHEVKGSDSETVTNNGEDGKLVTLDTTLDVAKTVTSEAKTYGLGDVVTYSIVVTNNGSVDYTNVVVKDDQTGLNETIDKLEKGESKTFTTSHTITESDIQGGMYLNTATAKADSITDGQGVVHTPQGSDSATIGDGTDYPIVDPSATLEVTKTVTSSVPEGQTAYELGDTITYSIAVKNTGNLTAKNFQVVDENADDFQAVTIESLAPGATTEAITAKHVVTADDIKAGSVVNVATTSGGETIDPSTKPDPTPGQAETEVDDLDTTLTVTKTAAEGTYGVGDTITYTITVTNDGNVPYTNVKVDDDNAGLHETIAILAVGETKTYTVAHVVTEADIIAGVYTNTVNAEADPIVDPKSETGETKTPSGTDTEVVGGESKDNTFEESNPDYKVTKTSNAAELHEDGLLYEGDVVTYTVSIENTGNLTLTDVTLSDDLDGATLVSDTDSVASLAPGETFSAEYQYTVTQDDIIAGSVVNTATADVTNPDDKKPIDTTKPDKTGEVEDQTVDSSPNYKVYKTSNAKTLHEDGLLYEGDVVTYTVTIENTGNLTLTDVKLSDDLAGAELISSTDTVASLEPGETFSAEYQYTVKQSDIVAGKVVNTATASVTNPDPDTKIPEDADKTGTKTDPTETAKPSFVIEKTDNGATQVAEGQEITYTLTVTNNGNVDLTDVNVVDELTGLNTTIASLAKGATETLTTVYTVKQSDIVAGKITNVATGTAKDPSGNDVTGTPGEKETTTEPMNASFKLEKTDNGASEPGVGDTINYTITVTNDGNVDLTDVNVVDELTGLNETIDKLAAGGVKTFKTSYTVTEDDMVEGKVVNTVTGSATDPKGDTTTGTPDEVTTKTEDIYDNLTVEKTVTEGTYKVYDVGDTIEYTIKVTNNGNVTAYGVVVSDDLTGFTSEEFDLAAGKSEEFTTSYEVTEADIEAGKVTNVGTAEGTDPAGKDVTGEDENVVDDTPQTDPSNPDHPSLARRLTVDPLDDVVYNGKAQSQHDTLVGQVKDAKTGATLVEGTDFEVSFSDDVTNVGTVTATIKGLGNYAGDIQYVNFQIKPRPLVITIASASKVYDGTALGTTIQSVEGLANGESLVISATDTLTEVGTLKAENYQINEKDSTAKKSNYTITVVAGTLEVTAPAVTPTPDNGGNGGTTDGGTTPTPVTPATTPVDPIDAIADTMEEIYETVTGDETPENEQIFDDDTPMGGAEHRSCWVHFYIGLGIVITAIYGLVVWFRRTNHTRKLRKNVNDILGDGPDPDEGTANAGKTAGMEA